jgi:hypothetical protein
MSMTTGEQGETREATTAQRTGRYFAPPTLNARGQAILID